jgi:uncharacterized protein (DUF1778 family)
MARAVSETGRIELRIDPADKAVLARAAALEHTDVTGFILRNILPAAREVIERSERLVLSERDSVRVLELLHLPTMMPLICLDRRGNISRRIGHEGLGPPGQRKIDVTHLDQPDPASRDVGQSSP